MRFLYKIWSGYDGFTPAKLPLRIRDGMLNLGWKHYLDEADKGTRVWVYFHGPRVTKPGVYVRGRIATKDVGASEVRLVVDQWSSARTLTDSRVCSLVSRQVQARGRQVFVVPDTWLDAVVTEECTLLDTGSSCLQRRCGGCRTWDGLPQIEPGHSLLPERLRVLRPLPDGWFPAYWAVPPRSYYSGRGLTPGVQQTTWLFKDFKMGARSRAYPFALGMHTRICSAPSASYSCLVPVPLSPDKTEAGEMHRTYLLARELGRLMDLPVRKHLSLTAPIGKRREPWKSMSKASYEWTYMDKLRVGSRVRAETGILLVDDAATWGTTLAACWASLRKAGVDAPIGATSAVQMAVRSVVADEVGLCAPQELVEA